MQRREFIKALGGATSRSQELSEKCRSSAQSKSSETP
jgi:hypothetical protein